jgi:hypothetical protein
VRPSERIPLFDGEKQQKPLIPAPRRPNATLQAIDSIRVWTKFRYAANSGIFSAEQGNYLAEQRNAAEFVGQDFLPVRHHIAPVSAPLWMPWNGLIFGSGRSGEPADGGHNWGR